MICKFCQQDKPSIDAHIIAKCLLKPLLSSSGPLLLISKDATQNSKKFWTGVYDSNMLCTDCDNKFSPWEEYAAQLFAKLSKKPSDLNTTKYYLVDKFDYAKLKLCLLATLWKMSVTKRPEYKHVNLGTRYEREIRTMLDNADPGPPEKFSVVLLQFSDYVGRRSAIGTHTQKWKNTTFYHLGLPHFVATIKIGSEYRKHIIQDAILHPDRPLVIVLGNHTIGSEWVPTFKKISIKNQKRSAKPR